MKTLELENAGFHTKDRFFFNGCFQVKPYYTLIYERVCLDMSEGIVKESSQGTIRHMMSACIVLHGYIFVLIRIDVNS
jgi:hypothetical protein